MAAVMLGASAGLSMYSGITQYTSAQAEAKMYRQQGDLQAQEAYREARRIEEEGRSFAQEQKMAYIGSGVQFAGSGVVTLAQTRKWAKEEADAMRSRGRALQRYQYRAGGIRASQGRAALLSGFADAAKSFYIQSSLREPKLKKAEQ